MTREYHSWFGGSAVPTGGIAGVAVTAERRGEKLLDELFRVVLEHGLRERGEAVSTLFSRPRDLPKFGYELLSSYDEVEVPSATLARIRPPAGVRTRRATPADFDAVREVYDTWAAAQNGPLTRRGPSFPADAIRSSTRSPGSRSRSTKRATSSVSRAGSAARGPATPRASRSPTCSH